MPSMQQAFGSIHRAFKLDGKQVTLPAGTALLHEHKMCETPKGDSFTFYAKTGASANAFTSYDRTCYLFSATQKINENLDILLGMVGKPWFTKATIEKEQGHHRPGNQDVRRQPRLAAAEHCSAACTPTTRCGTISPARWRALPS